jgi:hypothetical protein
LAVLLALTAAPAKAFIVPPIMPVQAVSANGQGVTVRVPSPGCTLSKADLTVAIGKTERGPMLLIAQKHPGAIRECRADLGPADITWTYEELSLQPGQAFSLANPLAAPP